MSRLIFCIFFAISSTYSLERGFYGFGNEGNGQLGRGIGNSQTAPVLLGLDMDQVVDISIGAAHTLVLRSDGTVLVAGANSYGQLGLGYTSNAVGTFTVSPYLSKVTAIAAGSSHSVVLMDGKVWVFGLNNYGQLGIGNTVNQVIPMQVSSITKTVLSLAGSSFNTYVLFNDGTAVGFGENGLGQLADGSTSTRSSPVVMGGVPSGLSIIKLAAASASVMVMLSDKTILCAGINLLCASTSSTAQTTLGATRLPKNIKTFSISNSHGLALLDDGTVLGWGYNYYNNIDNTNTGEIQTPVAISGMGSVVVAKAGLYTSYYIKSDENLYDVGSNAFGVLGIGDSPTGWTSTIKKVPLTNVRNVFIAGYYATYVTVDPPLYTSAQFTSSEFTTKSITSASITSAEFTSAQMTTSEMTTQELTSAELTSAEFTTASLTSASVTSSEMTTAEFTTSELTTSEMTTAELTTDSVTTSEMTTSELTTATFTSGAITTSAMTTSVVPSTETILSKSENVDTTITFKNNYIGQVIKISEESSKPGYQTTFKFTSTGSTVFTDQILYVFSAAYGFAPSTLQSVTKSTTKAFLGSAKTLDGVSWVFPSTLLQFKANTDYYFYLGASVTGTFGVSKSGSRRTIDNSFFEWDGAKWNDGDGSLNFVLKSTNEDGEGDGDPYFIGFNNQHFEFDGSAGRIYNVYNDPWMNLNSYFGIANSRTKRGTVMTKIGLSIGSHNLSFDVNADHSHSYFDIVVDGIVMRVDSSALELSGCVSIQYKRAILITTPRHEVYITPTRGKQGHINVPFFNVHMHHPDEDGTKIGGVLGQTAVETNVISIDEADFVVDTLLGLPSFNFYELSSLEC